MTEFADIDVPAPDSPKRADEMYGKCNANPPAQTRAPMRHD